MSSLAPYLRCMLGSLRGGASIRFCAAVLCASALAQSPTATTLAVTLNGNPVSNIPSQTAVTLTATVTSGSAAVMPAQVDFCDAAPPNCTGADLLGMAQMTHAGTAVIEFIPGPGTHNYQAVFLGTNSYRTSTSAPSPAVTVAVIDPTTIESGGSPGNYSLSASVAGGGTAFPTGTVSFIDTSNANYVLATATLMQGQGSFGGQLLKTAYSSQSTNPPCVSPGVAIADFNGDGRPDLVLGVNAVLILFGIGDALFTPAPAQPVAGLCALDFATGDFNQDGKQDFVMTQTGSNGAAYAYVLLGNGDGTFTEPQVFSVPGQAIVLTGDFNRDGIPDIVFSAGTTVAAGATVMVGNGDGTFNTSTMAPPAGLTQPPCSQTSPATGSRTQLRHTSR